MIKSKELKISCGKKKTKKNNTHITFGGDYSSGPPVDPQWTQGAFYGLETT